MTDKLQSKTEQEIDDIVVAQATDDSAWEEPIKGRGVSGRIRSGKTALDHVHESALREVRKQDEMMRHLGLDNRRLRELAEQHRMIQLYWSRDFASVAQNHLSSLHNIVNSQFFETTRQANLALVHLVERFQKEQTGHLGELSQAWRQQVDWVKRLEGVTLGRAISEHLAKTTEISVLAQSSMALLRQDQIGNIFNVSEEYRTALRTTFADLSGSYKNLFAFFEQERRSVLSVPPSLSRLPAVEFFNAADLLQAISAKPSSKAVEKDDEEDQREIARDEISKETKDVLEVLLADLNPDLVALRLGARQSLTSTNPDRIRHFISSYRELFTHVLHGLAPDEQIRTWSTAPEHYANARPTRRARLLYISRNINQPAFSPFLEKDIDAVLSAITLFQKGTHAITSGYSLQQLKALEIRIEAALRFMLEVSKADGD